MSARKVMALPLIPINKLEYAFEEIAKEAPDSIKLLVNYFNEYWMTKIKWSLWNVSDVDTRTNNVVEGSLFLIFFLYLIFIIQDGIVDLIV